MAKIVSAKPKPPRSLDPSVPVSLERVCLQALATDPEARYPHGEALAADLDRALAGEAVEARSLWLGPARLGAVAALLITCVVALLLSLQPTVGEPQASPPSPIAHVGSEIAAVDSGGSLAPVSTPTLSLLPRAAEVDPGLTTYIPRSMQVVDDQLIVLEDYRADASEKGYRLYLSAGLTVSTFSPETLSRRRSIKPHAPGVSGRMAATRGLVATGAGESQVMLWELPDLTPAGALDGHEGKVTALAFSPQGDLLLTVDVNHVRLWRVSDRTLLMEKPLGECYCVAFLSTGDGFLVNVKRKPEGKKKTVMLLERWTNEGEILASLPASYSWRLAVHPDGTRALTSRWKPPQIDVWKLNAADSEQPLELERTVDLDAPTINEFLPDPTWERVVTISGDGTLTQCSLDSGKRTHRQRKISIGMMSALASSGDSLYSAGADRQIRASSFTHLEDRGVGTTEEHAGPLIAIRDWGTACEHPVHSLLPPDSKNREGVDYLKGAPALCSMNGAGAVTAMNSDEGNVIIVLPRYREGIQVRAASLQVQYPIRAVGILPDAQRFLVALEDGSIHLGRAERSAWRELRPATATEESWNFRPSSYERKTLQTLALCVDASGERGFAAGEEAPILAWDLTDAEAPRVELTGHTPPVITLATMRDRLFAGEAGGAVSVFTLDNDTFLRSLPGASMVTALLPMRSGKQLLVGSEDGWIRHWDVEQATVLAEGRLPDADFARSFCKLEGEVQVGTQLGRRYDVPFD
jgi:WD40 repeat protein